MHFARSASLVLTIAAAEAVVEAKASKGKKWIENVRLLF